MVPAALAGSIAPPVIGNVTRVPLALARPVGATETPSDPSAFAVPLFKLTCVLPPDRPTAAERRRRDGQQRPDGDERDEAFHVKPP